MQSGTVTYNNLVFDRMANVGTSLPSGATVQPQNRTRLHYVATPITTTDTTVYLTLSHADIIREITFTSGANHTINIRSIVAGRRHKILVKNETSDSLTVRFFKDSSVSQEFIYSATPAIATGQYCLIDIYSTYGHIIITQTPDLSTTQL